MLKLFRVELLLLMIVLVFEKGEGLKCFVCRSDTHKGCGNNFTFSEECPKKENRSVYCRKIKQKLKFKNEDSWTSIRECAYEKGHLDCYQYKWLEIAYQETCECVQENCNLGSSFTLNISIVFLISLIWIFNCFKTDNT